MSDCSTTVSRFIVGKPQFIFTQDETYESFANKTGLDLDMLLAMNDPFKFKKKEDLISGTTIRVPIGYEASTIGVTVQYDALEPVLKKMRPFLRELFDIIRKFDSGTRSFVSEVNKSGSVKIITHLDIYEKTYSDIEKSFITDEACGYTQYRKKILSSYVASLKKYGIFHRNIVYLYHIAFNTGYCQITDPDKILNALIYAQRYFVPCLNRIGDVVNFLSLTYQALTGGYGDYVLYQNITDMLDGMMGLLNGNFRQSGEITELIGKNPLKRFELTNVTRNVIITRNRDNPSTLIKDTDVFDYGKDYKGESSAAKINALRDDLLKAYQDALTAIHDSFSTRMRDVSLQWYSFHVPQVRKFFDEVKKDMADFSAGHRDFSGKFKPGILERFRDATEIAIKNAESFRGASAYSSAASTALDRMDATMQIYHLGVSIYCLAAGLDELPGIQKLFADDEIQYAKAEHYFDLLDKASRDPMGKDATDCMREIYGTIEEFQESADKLIHDGFIINTIIKVVVLVLAIAAIVVITVFTGGAGAALTGTLGGLGASLTTTQAVVVLVAEAASWAIAVEALMAIVQRRDMSSVYVMEGFMANIALLSLFRYVEVICALGTAAREAKLLPALSRALVIPGKAAMFTLATIVGTMPGFIYRVSMMHNRMPNSEEWYRFLATSALLGGAFSTLTVSIEQFSAATTQYRNVRNINAEVAKMKSDLAECQRLYAELNTKYGTTISFERAQFDDIVRSNNTLLDKMKALSKNVKELRRTLIQEQSQLSKMGLKMDVEDYAGLMVVDHLLDESTRLIKYAAYREPARYGLAVEITNRIFGKSSADGILQVGATKSLYAGKVPLLISRRGDIEKLLPNYDVVFGQKTYVGQDAGSEGILALSLRSKDTGKYVDSITVIDINGEGGVSTLSPALDTGVPSGDYVPFGESTALALKGPLELYRDIMNDLDGIMKLVNMKTRDVNHPLANLSAVQRTQRREMLRAAGIKSKYVCMITKNRAAVGLSPHSQQPITFVLDAVDAASVYTRKEFLINIGHGKRSIDAGGNDFLLRVFRIDDPAVLTEANTESVYRGYLDMKRRAAVITKGGPHDPGFKVGDYAYDQITKFKTDHGKLMQAFGKRYHRAMTDGDMRALIEKVNSKPYTDTHRPDSYVMSEAEFNNPAIVDGPADRIARIRQGKTKDQLQDDLEYLVLDMAERYLCVYGQFANNGYTLTILGNKGFGEYNLHDDVTSVGSLKGGFTEVFATDFKTVITEER